MDKLFHLYEKEFFQLIVNERNIRINSPHDYTQKILDKIIKISKIYIQSNKIEYAFLYINDEDDRFTNLYITSSELNPYIKEFKALISESVEIISDKSDKSIKDYIEAQNENVIIKISGSITNYESEYFVKSFDKFNKSKDSIVLGPFLEKTYFSFIEFLQAMDLPDVSKYIAIIPIRKSVLPEMSNIHGWAIMFLGKELTEKDGVLQNINVKEIEYAENFLSLTNDLVFEYELKLINEKKRIFQSLVSLFGLYNHSFGNYIRIINKALHIKGKEGFSFNEITPDDISKINGVKNEIREIRSEILSKYYNPKINNLQISFDKRLNPIQILGNLLNIEYSKNFKKQNIQVTTNFIDNEDIFFDKIMLVEIIKNIFGNAIKAFNNITTNRTINITTRVVTEKGLRYYKMSISDNGCGFNNYEKDHVLKSKSTSYWNDKELKGSGLGLYLSNSLLKMFGGRLEIPDKSELLNTTICIFFPINK